MTNKNISKNFTTNSPPANNLVASILSLDDVPSAAKLIETTILSGTLQKPYHLRARAEKDLYSDIASGHRLIGIRMGNSNEIIGCLTLSPHKETQSLNPNAGNASIIRSLCIAHRFSGMNLSSLMIDLAINLATRAEKSAVFAKVAIDNKGSMKIFKDNKFVEHSRGFDIHHDKDGNETRYLYTMMVRRLPTRSPDDDPKFRAPVMQLVPEENTKEKEKKKGNGELEPLRLPPFPRAPEPPNIIN